MTPRDTLELLLLAALWGCSFLFMRVAVPEFGPVALAAVRVSAAAALLLALLFARRARQPLSLRHITAQWDRWLIAGLTTTALPFLCFCFAAQFLKTGVLAIFNAATPLFGALIAALWLKQRHGAPRVIGLGLGFAGVVWLASAHVGYQHGRGSTLGALLPVLACLSATVLYGFSTNYAQQYLSEASPLQQSTITLSIASALLLVPAWATWPAHTPSAHAWGCALALAVVCTGAAYLLFFRLLSRIGPTNTMSVTFLIPAFAVVWGLVFLGEPIEQQQIVSGAIILFGTALSTGILRLS